MVQNTGRPAYVQIADDLREQIHSGVPSSGESLPSTGQLAKQYEASASVINMAITTLRTEGLVVGQQVKALYVRNSTEPAMRDDQLGAIGAELRTLSERLAAVERNTRTTQPGVTQDVIAQHGEIIEELRALPADDAAVQAIRLHREAAKAAEVYDQFALAMAADAADAGLNPSEIGRRAGVEHPSGFSRRVGDVRRDRLYARHTARRST